MLRGFRAIAAGRVPALVARRRRSRWTRGADRPQPRLDLERGRGMAVTVGRVRPCPILDLRLVLLGHNTIRGAAGQAVQIAELLVAEGRVDRPA